MFTKSAMVTMEICKGRLEHNDSVNLYLGFDQLSVV